MKFFCLLLCTILVVVSQAIDLKGHEDYDHLPVEYEFHYAVHDPHTGDIKSQKEKRKNDKVEGTYELIEPDGHRRIVHYKADDHSGFEATVLREPTDIKIPIPEQHKIGGGSAKLVATPIVHYGHKSEYNYKY